MQTAALHAMEVGDDIPSGSLHWRAVNILRFCTKRRFLESQQDNILLKEIEAIIQNLFKTSLLRKRARDVRKESFHISNPFHWLGMTHLNQGMQSVEDMACGYLPVTYIVQYARWVHTNAVPFETEASMTYNFYLKPKKSP